MGKMIAKCGLDCAGCGAYKAWKTNDDEIRKKTAKQWSKMFGASIAPESINCQGCQAGGKEAVLFSHCSVCGIRSCALEKGVRDCSECDDFGCEKLQEIWPHAPEAKAQLMGQRSR